MNVLMIVADDLNAWIGALGRNPDVKTPNIDALAERGTLFTHAYCPAPYCNASRIATFTGRLPSATGVYGDEPFWEAPDRPPTIMEVLSAGGYHTRGAGKVFHGGFRYPLARRRRNEAASWSEEDQHLEIWDEFVSNRSDPLPGRELLNGLFGQDRLEATPHLYLFDWGRLPDGLEAAMPDAVVTETVSEFLRAPGPEPFFCAAGLYKPHLPWYLPHRYFDLYDPSALNLPPVKRDDLSDVPTIARRWALTAPTHHDVAVKGQWRDAVHAYLAAISYCDARVGEILAALDSSPVRDRTAVILFGDNGFHLGEKLHWRKFALWEEATRVPLIVSVPGRHGSRVHTPVSLVDLFPTLLELAGIDPDPDTDGESLLPALVQPSEHHRVTPARMTWGRDNDSVRTDEWRYTRYSDGTEELYDHRTDPYEWTNLAGHARFQQVKERLGGWIVPDGALD